MKNALRKLEEIVDELYDIAENIREAIDILNDAYSPIHSLDEDLADDVGRAASILEDIYDILTGE